MSPEASNEKPSQSPSVCLTTRDEIEKVFNEFDENGDGKISTSELYHIMKSLSVCLTIRDEIEKVFNKFDENGDGKISTSELDHIMKSPSVCLTIRDEIEKVFNKFDENGDGKISTSELDHVMKSPSVCLTIRDEIEKVFNKFDENGDGMISTSELDHIMKSLGSETSEEEVRHVMETIDTDNKGYISLEGFTEFCKASASSGGDENDVVEMELKDVVEVELKDTFNHYDLNKNELISSSELHQILWKLGEKFTEDDCVEMIACVKFEKMMSRSNGGGASEGAA